jgi:heme exporter protein B
MPLYVPLLIFATQAVTSAVAGLPYDGALDFLMALFFLSLTLAPFATASALRISLS